MVGQIMSQRQRNLNYSFQRLSHSDVDREDVSTRLFILSILYLISLTLSTKLFYIIFSRNNLPIDELISWKELESICRQVGHA